MGVRKVLGAGVLVERKGGTESECLECVFVDAMCNKSVSGGRTTKN